MDTMITREQFERLSTQEQYGELLKATEEAKQDDTPYVAIADDEIHVLGDPNKTEVKKHDYEISFAFPNTAEWKSALEQSGDSIEKETENFLRVTRTFKNVWLAPRRASHVAEAFARLQAFLNKVTETNDEGEIEIKQMSIEEMMDMMRDLNIETEEALYRAVGAFLGLTEQEREFMLLPSVIYNVVKITLDNPEVINGSDVLFG